MLKPKISVIVPVYKAEAHLCRCVDSILSQTFKDFELLLIDDGSPDKSGEICDEYARKDSRVRVFHKKNGGVSSARNVGLDNARGEWVAFVDSDDYIENGYLATLNLVEQGTEVIHFGFKKETSDKSIYNCFEFKHPKLVPLEIFFTKQYFSSCSVSYFFAKSLVESIRFNENLKYSEDRQFIIQVLLHTKSNIQLVNNICYIYTYNENSATNTKRSLKHYIDDLLAFQNIIEYININNINVRHSVIKYMYNLFVNSFFMMYSMCDERDKSFTYVAQKTIKRINSLSKMSNFDSEIFFIIPSVIYIKCKIYRLLRILYYKIKK